MHQKKKSYCVIILVISTKGWAWLVMPREGGPLNVFVLIRIVVNKNIVNNKMFRVVFSEGTLLFFPINLSVIVNTCSAGPQDI